MVKLKIKVSLAWPQHLLHQEEVLHHQLLQRRVQLLENIASLPTSGGAAAVSSGGSSGGSGGSSISPSANPDGFYAGSGVVSSDGSSAPGFTQNTVFTLTKSIRDRAAIVSSGVSIDDAILENNGAILNS